MKLADFDAYTFDVYGTLIDWEPSIAAFLERWARANGIGASSAALIDVYDTIRGPLQQERPGDLYPDILRGAFERLCQHYGVAIDMALREELASAPSGWPPFADTPTALKQLQARGKLCALSNIDNASLAASCRKMDIKFDIEVTAERVRAYKPDLAHFHTALADLAALGIRRDRILHVAQSLRADIVPANRLGLRCVWVHRPRGRLGLKGPGTEGAAPDMTVDSLATLVAQLNRA
jgi:2-haloacid dehalogenase